MFVRPESPGRKVSGTFRACARNPRSTSSRRPRACFAIGPWDRPPSDASHLLVSCWALCLCFGPLALRRISLEIVLPMCPQRGFQVGGDPETHFFLSGSGENCLNSRPQGTPFGKVGGRELYPPVLSNWSGRTPESENQDPQGLVLSSTWNRSCKVCGPLLCQAPKAEEE
ncbi:hypothetical protein VUR80DRAFT_3254 [Thermomyces stellatus]